MIEAGGQKVAYTLDGPYGGLWVEIHPCDLQYLRQMAKKLRAALSPARGGDFKQDRVCARFQRNIYDHRMMLCVGTLPHVHVFQA